MTINYENRMRRVIQHIYDNPTGDLSLDALADVAALSRFHWHRVFRTMTGETCTQAVKRIRMHLASIALIDGDRPVSEIAASVGYPQAASFSRAFSDIYRVSPSVFRDRGQAQTPPITFRSGETFMYDVDIRDMPARKLAALAHTGPYSEIGRSFQQLFAMIGARGLFPHIGPGVGVYYDDVSEKPAEELKSHAGVILNGIDAPDGTDAIELAGGRSAVLTLNGPYSGLPAAWDHLYANWLVNSGEVPADVAPYEIYLNDPTNTAPDDLITEIVVPLKG